MYDYELSWFKVNFPLGWSSAPFYFSIALFVINCFFRTLNDKHLLKLIKVTSFIGVLSVVLECFAVISASLNEFGAIDWIQVVGYGLRVVNISVTMIFVFTLALLVTLVRERKTVAQETAEK